MKKKILIMILIGIICTFLIYKFNQKDKIYFLSLGDGLATGMTAYNINGYNYNDYIRDYLEKENKLEQYIYEFSEVDQSIENLITSIEHNYIKEETNLTIQQAISKSKLITIGIGIDKLASQSLKQSLSTKEKEDYEKDIDKLLKLIRNFNNGKIYLLGIYKAYNIKTEEVTEINKTLKQIANNNKVIYIDISDLSDNSEYFLLDNSYYLNYKGHREIANRILKNYNI